MKEKVELGREVKFSIWYTIWASSCKLVYDSTPESVFGSVGKSVRDPIGVPVKDAIRGKIENGK